MKPRLRLIPSHGKPRIRFALAPEGTPTHAEKLARAKDYLRERGIYVLDRGSPKPKWGLPGTGA